MFSTLPKHRTICTKRFGNCRAKKGEMKLVCDNENGLFRDVQMNDFCSAWERIEDGETKQISAEFAKLMREGEIRVRCR